MRWRYAFCKVCCVRVVCVFQFVGLEALVTAISDMNPSFFHMGHRRKLLLLFISVISFFIGLVMVTEVKSTQNATSIIITTFPFVLKDCYNWVVEWTPIPYTGRTVYLPVVWLLCLQWDDFTPDCHATVAVCWMGVWWVRKQVHASWHQFLSRIPSFLCFHLLTGAERFYDNVQDMIGYRPFPMIKYCLKYVTPVICMVSKHAIRHY